MDHERLAVGTGVVACVLLVTLAALPYALFSAGAVGAYYSVGILGPNWTALFGVVATLTLVAGVTRRSDPAVAAGIAVTLGVFSVVLAASWALPARSIAAGFDTDPVFGYHPLSVPAASILLLAAAGWFTRAVLSSSDT